MRTLLRRSLLLSVFLISHIGISGVELLAQESYDAKERRYSNYDDEGARNLHYIDLFLVDIPIDDNGLAKKLPVSGSPNHVEDSLVTRLRENGLHAVNVHKAADLRVKAGTCVARLRFTILKKKVHMFHDYKIDNVFVYPIGKTCDKKNIKPIGSTYPLLYELDPNMAGYYFDLTDLRHLKYITDYMLSKYGKYKD